MTIESYLLEVVFSVISMCIGAYIYQIWLDVTCKSTKRKPKVKNDYTLQRLAMLEADDLKRQHANEIQALHREYGKVIREYQRDIFEYKVALGQSVDLVERLKSEQVEAYDMTVFWHGGSEFGILDND